MRRLLFCFPFVILALRGDTFADLSARATAARQANDVATAVDLYRKAVDVNPSWQEGWWFLGTLLYDADQFPPARDAFQHFVKLDAQAAPGWAFLGLCEFETADYAKALHDVEHGLSLGADKEPQLGPVLLYHEALLLTREGQFDDALQKYAGLLRAMGGMSPKPSLLLAIGLATLRAPLIPKEVAASDTELYTSAGRVACYVLQGDYAKADAGFQDLLNKYPNALNVHYARGVYLIARDPDQAFEEFQREMKEHPSNTAAAKMLAWGLLSRGDAAPALPYAEVAAAAPDAAPFAKYLLGRALVESGSVERGVPYLQFAEKADAQNADVHVTLAVAYAQMGKPVLARREREIAMQMETGSQAVAHP